MRLARKGAPGGRSASRAALPLPMTPQEVAQRGWDAVDVVFVTGDAYVDHPSFAAALLARVLEAEGFRVAILSQPDWHSCQPWHQFGRPRVCFAISAGNMDSMINHYTAARKRRNDDAYSPGGRTGRRPDRATLAYCQRAREAWPGVPIVAGGVEASLRRLAHYDYWSNKVRRAIILDAKADLVVYGMGERPLVEIVRRLSAGEPVEQLRDMRGVVYRLGASEAIPAMAPRLFPTKPPGNRAVHELAEPHRTAPAEWPDERPDDSAAHLRDEPPDALEHTVVLPSYEEVVADRWAFVRMTRLVHRESNPFCARRLVQYHGREAVVVNPPSLPLSEAELDYIYGLPFTRRPHPSYQEPIPALEVVRDSVQIMRGCFGGCTFCSLTLHQGRTIQSRSPQSVLAEIRALAGQPGFSGVVSDLGGPTANMYRMGCNRPEIAARCRRTSCLYPTRCRLLRTDHGPLVRLLKAARRLPGLRRVLVASGVRMDLALRSPAYLSHLVRHHTGGLLKVAPEHCAEKVLRRMGKCSIDHFERFARKFSRLSRAAGREQYLVPYFMAGHPGCDLEAMIELAVYLKRTGYRPEKVQDFIPAPMELATCMYYTGIDPMTGEEVYVPRGARERRWQRALLQFWKPENHEDVRRALEQAGRLDLIGSGPDCLIPARPPQRLDKGAQSRAGAWQARGARQEGPPFNPRAAGYRPYRKTFRRR